MSRVESAEIATRQTTYFKYKPEFENISLQVGPRISNRLLIHDEFERQGPVPLCMRVEKKDVEGLQELSITDITWKAFEYTSNEAVRCVVRAVAHVGDALDNISRSSSIWRNANLSRAEERAASVNISDASENLFEIRRLTGFSWGELASLLNVTSTTLSRWAKGAKINKKNREQIAGTLKVLRYSDQGSAESNAQKLKQQIESERSPLEMIRSKDYEAAKQLLSYGPSRPQIRRTSSDTSSWIGEFQPILMHPNADGTESFEPLPDEPEPVTRKRSIKRG